MTSQISSCYTSLSALTLSLLPPNPDLPPFRPLSSHTYLSPSLPTLPQLTSRLSSLTSSLTSSESLDVQFFHLTQTFHTTLCTSHRSSNSCEKSTHLSTCSTTLSSMKSLLPNLSRTEAATEIYLASSILLDQSYANHITTVRKIIEDTLVIDGDTVKVKEWEKGFGLVIDEKVSKELSNLSSTLNTHISSLLLKSPSPSSYLSLVSTLLSSVYSKNRSLPSHVTLNVPLKLNFSSLPSNLSGEIESFNRKLKAWGYSYILDNVMASYIAHVKSSLFDASSDLRLEGRNGGVLNLWDKITNVINYDEEARGCIWYGEGKEIEKYIRVKLCCYRGKCTEKDAVENYNDMVYSREKCYGYAFLLDLVPVYTNVINGVKKGVVEDLKIMIGGVEDDFGGYVEVFKGVWKGWLKKNRGVAGEEIVREIRNEICDWFRRDFEDMVEGMEVIGVKKCEVFQDGLKEFNEFFEVKEERFKDVEEIFGLGLKEIYEGKIKGRFEGDLFKGMVVKIFEESEKRDNVLSLF